MSQIRNKIIFFSAVLIVLFLIISSVNSKNSALNTVKNFYAQYLNCINNNQINACYQQIKDHYGHLSSSLALLFTDNKSLQDLPVNARKLQLASDFYRLPALKNAQFSLTKLNWNQAEVKLSGFLDPGEEELSDIQINILKDGLKASYPDFIVSQPISYNFELSKTLFGWTISDVYFAIPHLSSNVSQFINECQNNLQKTNQESLICAVNDNKLSVLPLIFNKAGFLATPETQSEARETKNIDENSKQLLINNLKEGTLIIYLVNLNKILSQNILESKGINPQTKTAFLTPLEKPKELTKFCVINTPLFKDGMINLYPNNYISKNSVWIDKNGYLICSDKVNWNKPEAIWGIVGVMPNMQQIASSRMTYFGIKFYLPLKEYYGKDFTVFDYIQNVGDKGQVFYRLAIPTFIFK